MIVTMKKVFLVTMAEHREDTLKKLKKLGVLHVTTEKKTSDSLQTLEEQRGRVERCLAFLPADSGKEAAVERLGLEEVFQLVQEVNDLTEEVRRQEDELDHLKKEAEHMAVWGDFSPADLRYLREKGIDLRLFSLPPEKVTLLQDYPAFPLSRTKTRHYLAAILPEEALSDNLQDLGLPQYNYLELLDQVENKRKDIESLRDKLKGYGKYLPALHHALEELNDRREFETVRENFSKDEKLEYLSGFLPEDSIDILKKGAEKYGWALLITEPEEGDPVPTLVRNNRFVRMIEPIFKLLGTTPGYHEYDISLWFLLFFSFFFAVIIGDAGYGAIFLILSVFIRIKMRKPSDMVRLLMTLSVTTIAWGAITGTWFGSETLSQVFPLNLLIIDAISSFNPTSGETIRLICFIVGTAHIVLAHFQNFLKKLPALKAFGDLSWLVMVLGLYYVVLNLVLDATKYPIPSYALIMIGSGLLGVFLFDKQEKGTSFFKGVLRGLTDFLPTFLSGISAFSDIISYIRLYAVGLATVAIAGSFNSMAAGLGSGVVAFIAGALIAVFGHSLNLAMGALSVIVHGVRLNMLEYAGHRGIEWTGIKYEPFRENEKLKEKEI
ncbi:MAG: V-type ATP synthase subunit I [Spirochaetales bacterium]|nr:V-type ATP synthase subunit I [Spirochaetales bacterium]